MLRSVLLCVSIGALSGGVGGARKQCERARERERERHTQTRTHTNNRSQSEPTAATAAVVSERRESVSEHFAPL